MTVESNVVVDVGELIAFFDEEVAGSAGHASALVSMAGEDLGAALVADYLRSQGTDVEILTDRCTQGTQKGCRLDRWIWTRSAAGEILYQVEIKNWSAHAIGGRKLARSASAAEVVSYKIERWEKEWSGVGFRKPQVAKVLTPMKSPRALLTVEPLVCFWTALHPTGAPSPWFSVPLAGIASFERVTVFSMSSYLRGLSRSSLTLPLPDFVARREWLRRIFPANTAASAD